MNAVKFPIANDVLLGGHPDVHDLPIFRGQYKDGQAVVISCWRMSWRERLSALFHGRVYAHFWARTHPPMALVTKPPEIAAADARVSCE